MVESIHYYDDEFEPPCFCAQQLLGALFGVVFAYTALLLCRSSSVVAIIQAAGIAFGLLGAEVATPCDINYNEMIKLTMILGVQSYILLLVCGTTQHGVVMLLSLLLSSVAAPIRSVLRYRAQWNEYRPMQGADTVATVISV